MKSSPTGEASNIYYRMKKILPALLILTGSLCIPGCEKDDICVDGDTPLLVVRFYNADNPTSTKSVTLLRVVGVGKTEPVDTFTDRSTTDSIALPLKVDASTSSFYFISDSATTDSLETGNIDTLAFNYTVHDVFVSRACGFVANFSDLTAQLQQGKGNWILDVEIDTTEITNSASAHVKIFH